MKPEIQIRVLKNKNGQRVGVVTSRVVDGKLMIGWSVQCKADFEEIQKNNNKAKTEWKSNLKKMLEENPGVNSVQRAKLVESFRENNAVVKMKPFDLEKAKEIALDRESENPNFTGLPAYHQSTARKFAIFQAGKHYFQSL